MLIWRSVGGGNGASGVLPISSNTYPKGPKCPHEGKLGFHIEKSKLLQLQRVHVTNTKCTRNSNYVLGRYLVLGYLEPGLSGI